MTLLTRLRCRYGLWCARRRGRAKRHEPLRDGMEITLGAIPHRVSIHEGAITFSDASGFWGTHTRLTFTRECDGQCWYIEMSATWDKVMVSHIVEAYRRVCETFGDNFKAEPEGQAGVTR